MTPDKTMISIELFDAAREFVAAVGQYAFTCHPADHISYQQTGAAFNSAALETMAMLPYSAATCDQWEAYDLAAGAFALHANCVTALVLAASINAVAETLLNELMIEAV